MTYFITRTLSLLGLTTLIVGLNTFKVAAETPTNTTISKSQITPSRKVTTSAADLQISQNGQTFPPSVPQTPTPGINQQTPDPVIEQEITPGRATRSGSSYIGAGGNIGLGGRTTISEGSFAVFSKIGLTRNFSVRPAALIGDNTVFLVPITFDLPIQSLTDIGEQQISIAPYLGAGAAISTGRDSTLGFLISGGVDVPVSPQLTATAGVNVGFIDETEIGLLLGIGYNF
ncbi:MAG: hypothetical protein KME23_12215 [Goleter apudmare HA4340-LM2]|nr:hypothetical protein [Goleter apudmare HA4340-LM2]